MTKLFNEWLDLIVTRPQIPTHCSIPLQQFVHCLLHTYNNIIIILYFLLRLSGSVSRRNRLIGEGANCAGAQEAVRKCCTNAECQGLLSCSSQGNSINSGCGNVMCSLLRFLMFQKPATLHCFTAVHSLLAAIE